MSDTGAQTDLGPQGLIRITGLNSSVSLVRRLWFGGVGVLFMLGASHEPLDSALPSVIVGLALIAIAILWTDKVWYLRPGLLTIDEVSLLRRSTRDLRPGRVRRVEAVTDSGGEGPTFHYVLLSLTDGGSVQSPELRSSLEAATLADRIRGALDVHGSF